MLVSVDQADAAAKELGISTILLECFTAIESGWCSEAPRYEPLWSYFKTPDVFAKKLRITLNTEIQLQKFSWGPIQVMGSVARELGYDDHLAKLIFPELGYRFGGLHLMRKIKSYGMTTDAVASYNEGHPAKGPDGKYIDQDYVDRFLSEWMNRGGHVLNGIELVVP